MPHYRYAFLATAALVAPLAAYAQQETLIGEVVVTAQKREQALIDVPIALTAYDARGLERRGVQTLDQLALFTPGFEVQQQSPNNPGFVMRGVTSSALESAFEPRVSIFQDGVSISKGEGSYVELFDVERVEVAKGPQSTLFGRGALVGALNIIQNKARPGAADAKLVVEAGDYSARRAEAMINAPVGETLAVRLAAVRRQRDGYVSNLRGGEDYQSVDTTALRGALAFAGKGSRRLDLIVNYQRDRPTGTAFKSLVIDQTDPVSGAFLADRRDPDGIAQGAGQSFQDGQDLNIDRAVWGATLLARWPLANSITLSSISAFRHFQSSESNDPDGLSLPLLTAMNEGKAKQWSQELRINFDPGGRLTAFAGASAFGYEGHHQTPLQIDERLAVAALTRQLNGAAVGAGLPATRTAPSALFENKGFVAALMQGLVAGASDNRTTAVFDPAIVLTPAQALAIASNLRSDHRETSVDTSVLSSFDLFADGTLALTPRFEVSAGLRYTRDKRKSGYSAFVTGGRSVAGGAIGAAQLASSGSPTAVAQAKALLAALQSPAAQQVPVSILPLFGFSFQPTAGNGAFYSDSLDDDGLTWRLAARYALDDRTNLYATYARGRRPRTLAARGPSAPFGPPQFGAQSAETVDSIELGAKFRRPERGLRGSAAVYGYGYKNFETVDRDGVRLITTNRGSARAYGVELEGEWSPTSYVDIFATYSFNHARFTNGAFDGNHLRQSPDHSASLGAAVRWPAPGGVLELRPTFTWQSKMFFDDNNDRPDLQQPPAALVADAAVDEFQNAYGLLNLTLTYTPTGRSLALELFATNLTNERYIIDAGNTGDILGLPTFVVGPPRMGGVRVTWRLP